MINAAGVVVHTNLGRAPLAERAAARMFEVARGYSNLEFDLDTGARGSRQDHLAGLLEAMFPGRASLVVNNAAGGVLLALDSLARGKAVVVSAANLVEIGGSFRIPEILEKGGARLIEVGTTNRTRTDDYRRAVSRNPGGVGALLKVHQSNFRIVGFTEAAATGELVALGAEFGIPVIEDYGSGNLHPLAALGVAGGGDEPTVAERVAAGADLVVFSGDKLLGGPQAGILLGAPAAVAACRRNPLARALRPDKTMVAGLQATLRIHAAGRAAEEIPAVRALARPLAEVAAARGPCSPPSNRRRDGRWKCRRDLAGRRRRGARGRASHPLPRPLPPRAPGGRDSRPVAGERPPGRLPDRGGEGPPRPANRRRRRAGRTRGGAREDRGR